MLPLAGMPWHGVVYMPSSVASVPVYSLMALSVHSLNTVGLETQAPSQLPRHISDSKDGIVTSTLSLSV